MVFNHRLFGEQEFNFSGQYHFEFKTEKSENNENKCLECRLNHEYPSKLYNSDNVELISYIIGDNGDGKTTLLELLMEILPYEGGISAGNGKNYLKYICVLKEERNSNIYIYSTLDKIEIKASKDIAIKNCRDNIIRRMRCNDRGFFACHEMEDTAVIFHSNVFDRNRYNDQKVFSGVEDISFNGLLYKDFDYRTTNQEKGTEVQLRIFLDSEMIRQITFISEFSGSDLQEWIPFSLPQRLYIYFKEEHDVLDSIYQYDKSEVDIENENIIYEYDRDIELNIKDIKQLRKVLAHICRDIIKRYDKLYKKSSKEFQYRLYKGILMSYIRFMFPDSVGEGTTRKFQRLITSLRNFMREFYFDSNVEFIEKLMEIADIRTDKLKNAVVKINDFARNMGKYGIKSQNFKFFFLTKSNHKAIIDFYRLFQATAFGAEYLTFRWEGLSSGEYNLLNMYSRIYSLRDKVRDKESIILLLDEADLSYHPKWQQKFMKSLVSFLNGFYKRQHIQIIVATHSPIMLSDALKGNVVFLNSQAGKDLENTFGANIYDLYRDGMFLDKDDMGIIGAYALDKMRYAMDKLNDWEKGQSLDDLEEIKRLIACIGEPIIKRIMQNRLEVIEQDMEGNDTNHTKISALIETLNELQPEQLAEVMERVQRK